MPRFRVEEHQVGGLVGDRRVEDLSVAAGPDDVPSVVADGQGHLAAEIEPTASGLPRQEVDPSGTAVATPVQQVDVVVHVVVGAVQSSPGQPDDGGAVARDHHIVVQLAEAVEAPAAPVVEERAPFLAVRVMPDQVVRFGLERGVAVVGHRRPAGVVVGLLAVPGRRQPPGLPGAQVAHEHVVVGEERQVPGVVLEGVRLDDVRIEAAVGEEAAVGREPSVVRAHLVGLAVPVAHRHGGLAGAAVAQVDARVVDARRVQVRGAAVEGDVAAGPVEVTEGGRVRRHLAGTVAVDQLRPADVDGRQLRRVRSRRGDHQERQTDDEQDLGPRTDQRRHPRV